MCLQQCHQDKILHLLCSLWLTGADRKGLFGQGSLWKRANSPRGSWMPVSGFHSSNKTTPSTTRGADSAAVIRVHVWTWCAFWRDINSSAVEAVCWYLFQSNTAFIQFVRVFVFCFFYCRRNHIKGVRVEEVWFIIMTYRKSIFTWGRNPQQVDLKKYVKLLCCFKLEIKEESQSATWTGLLFDQSRAGSELSNFPRSHTCGGLKTGALWLTQRPDPPKWGAGEHTSSHTRLASGPVRKSCARSNRTISVIRTEKLRRGNESWRSSVVHK